MTDVTTTPHRMTYVRRHLQFAWWSLLCFLTMGIMLETLHAFKIGWYLEEPEYKMRRLMWTLGHAHGGLLALVHVAFAATLFVLAAKMTRGRILASAFLMGASILLPGGFFLGGIFLLDGDPGVGVWLAPIGGMFLFVGVCIVAVGLVSTDVGEDPSDVKESSKKKKSSKQDR